MSDEPLIPDTSKAARWYSPPRLWSKLSRIAKIAGEKTLMNALILFYCMQDKDTPAWAKGVIVGALGYLILPMDLVPDIIPGAGYGDDWTAVVTALGTVAAYIKDDHKMKARERVGRLFGQRNTPAPPEFS